MKKIIRTTAPLLLILLFTYAAASKLLIFADFRGQLYNQEFPHWMAGILLYTLPPAELIIAGLLCFRKSRQAGLALSAGLLVIFSGYIALVMLHYWKETPCSCGGILTHMGWGKHLFFNLSFVLLALSAMILQPQPDHHNPNGQQPNTRRKK